MAKCVFLLVAVLVIVSISNVASLRSRRATNTYNPHVGLTVTIDSKSVSTPRCQNIPTKVTARITEASLNLGRTNFNLAAHDNRMKEMGAVGGDDKGHIIASSLGGVAEVWNLFPQAKRLNRGKESEPHETSVQRSNWKGLERKAKNFLKSGTAAERREVEWIVYFDYTDKTNPCRPYDIQVVSKFFKSGRETEKEGHAYVNDNFGYE